MASPGGSAVKTCLSRPAQHAAHAAPARRALRGGEQPAREAFGMEDVRLHGIRLSILGGSVRSARAAGARASAVRAPATVALMRARQPDELFVRLHLSEADDALELIVGRCAELLLT